MGLRTLKSEIRLWFPPPCNLLSWYLYNFIHSVLTIASLQVSFSVRESLSHLFCFPDYYYHSSRLRFISGTVYLWYILPIFQAYLMYISGISQVYLWHILATSQAYLGFISGISQVYLRYISGISRPHLRHISGISQACLRHISGISQAYLRHISGISQAYSRHISSKFQV